jgi:hypothetical protein
MWEGLERRIVKEQEGWGAKDLDGGCAQEGEEGHIREATMPTRRDKLRGRDYVKGGHWRRRLLHMGSTCHCNVGFFCEWDIKPSLSSPKNCFLGANFRNSSEDALTSPRLIEKLWLAKFCPICCNMSVWTSDLIRRFSPQYHLRMHDLVLWKTYSLIYLVLFTI